MLWYILFSIPTDTPLSKEDVDALNELLQKTKIELEFSSPTLEMVQQLLLGRGLEKLAKNLRAKIDKGKFFFTNFVTQFTGNFTLNFIYSDQAKTLSQEAGWSEI